ncbi:MAG: sodium:calcium antiporter [Clostridia bacterium]
MSTATALTAFTLGAVVSLATSWVLVSRIERIGARWRASEALLGLLAALAADTPEISSSISALSHHQQVISVGVILGSNVFNLAALLGLGALVAGRIVLHRRVLLLEGVLALWVAVLALLTVAHVASPVVGLSGVLVLLVPYTLVASLRPGERRQRLSVTRLRRWLGTAIAQEELELSAAIHPRRGRVADGVVAGIALVVVVAASVVMERAASSLGVRLAVPGIIVGTVVLAAVTSVPNAVAAVYLARRGRGAASLSTALNSNALNTAVGLLLPAAVLGAGHSAANATLVAWWYVAVTALLVGLAYRGRGLRRPAGAVIIGAYAVFLLVVLGAAGHGSAVVPASAEMSPLLIVVVAAVAGLWPAPGTRMSGGGAASQSGERREGTRPADVRTPPGSRPAGPHDEPPSREPDGA